MKREPWIDTRTRRAAFASCLILVVGSATWSQALERRSTKRVASDGLAVDLFGWSVDLFGDTAVAGAPFSDAVGTDNGAAYVFQLAADPARRWDEVAELLPAAPFGNELRFGWSVSLSGDTAVVGWPDFGFPTSVGAAVVFERNQGGPDAWGEVELLTASVPQSFSNFGLAVEIEGDLIVVGAPGSDSGRGAVYLFERDAGGPNAWGEVATISAADVQPNDEYGTAVALDGERLAVGSQVFGVFTPTPGAIYVHERDVGGSSAWGEVKKIIAAGSQALGRALAVSGEHIAAGGQLAVGPQGAVCVFEKDQGGVDAWGQVAQLTDPSPSFGSTVDLEAALLLIGNPAAAPGGVTRGLAYLHARDQGGAGMWGRVGALAAPDGELDDFFGFSVALSGTRELIGAYGDDDLADRSGAVYFLERVKIQGASAPSSSTRSPAR